MTADVRPEKGAIIDLSVRAKFRITGTDRLRYLNGQISNDVRKATEKLSLRACVLNAKGKINADLFLVADADSFLIDTEAEMREALPARLERYIIADDVQLEDVTDLFALLHLTGGDAGLGAAGFRTARAERFGGEGTDIWFPRAEREARLHELSMTLPMCDEACLEVFRIERGVPRWGRELTDEIIPTEANLELSAIDYSKGCYIGQEVISRIKMSGQTNKRLCGLISASDAPLVPGMRLTSKEVAGKDLGWLTSATRSATLEKEIALGYVKRGFNAIGTELDALAPENRSGGATTPVKVVELPFV